jgi:RNA polymerase sigma-70 factor (ECF subfamily)
LYHNYAVELLTIALQKTDDREVARELVQAVFVTLYNYKAFSHQIDSMKAYLYTMLKNRILDHYRHVLVQKKFYDHSSYQYAMASKNDVQSYIDTKDLELQLNEEIGKLPPQCQTVFRLRREQELSNREIALQMNISENTVEQHMRKALRVLRVALHIGKKALFLF